MGLSTFGAAKKRSQTPRCVTLPKVVPRGQFFTSRHANLATLNGDVLSVLWDMKSFQESGQITEAGSNNTSVLFDPKRPLLAVGDRSGVIKLIDAVKRGEPRKLVWRQPAPVHPVKFTKDGRFLLGLVARATGGSLLSVGGGFGQGSRRVVSPAGHNQRFAGRPGCPRRKS